MKIIRRSFVRVKKYKQVFLKDFSKEKAMLRDLRLVDVVNICGALLLILINIKLNRNR